MPDPTSLAEVLARHTPAPPSTCRSTPAAPSTAARFRHQILNLSEVPAPNRAEHPDPARFPRHSHKIEEYLPGLRALIRRLCAGDAPWPLWVYGPPGIGKTCAALSLCDRVARSEYRTADQVDVTIAAASAGRLDSEQGYRKSVEAVWRDVERCPLFVLDEIGRTRNASWSTGRMLAGHVEAVKGVLDRRQGKPLIVISNFGPAEIAELYDGAVLSRLSAGVSYTKPDAVDRRVQ